MPVRMDAREVGEASRRSHVPHERSLKNDPMMFCTARNEKRIAIDGTACSAPVARDDLVEGAARDDASLVQDRDVGAELLELGEVVRGVDDRRAVVSELADRAQDLAARLHVRTDGRLVHEHQARAVHDRHARVEPALLPARQMRGALAAFLCEAEEVHHLARARGRLASSEPVQFAEGREVLGDAQVGVDAELLGRVADQARGLDGGGAVAADAGGSGVGLAQPAQDRDERGLAGPVSSE